jgi:hypothetical protein
VSKTSRRDPAREKAIQALTALADWHRGAGDVDAAADLEAVASLIKDAAPRHDLSGILSSLGTSSVPEAKSRRIG